MDESIQKHLAEPLTDVGVLLLAADLIESRGLERHGFESPDGALCIQGAINVACGEEPHSPFGPRQFSALTLLQSHVNGKWAHIWILDESVSKSDVVALMRKAAR